ncbi:hypothetical protein [Streptomyces sp. SP2-10]|uniref:hypothetical protein n=1 Tax=Streptomyces sp. SP2-10 TaxID=2873385 RepID=UPI0035AB8804
MTPDSWEQWHEQRVETVSAPCGPLALTATHWIEDYPEGRLPDISGVWMAEEDRVVLTATEADGLSVDGRPFPGAAALAADTGPQAGARVAPGGKRLVVLVREGVRGTPTRPAHTEPGDPRRARRARRARRPV